MTAPPWLTSSCLRPNFCKPSCCGQTKYMKRQKQHLQLRGWHLPTTGNAWSHAVTACRTTPDEARLTAFARRRRLHGRCSDGM